MFADHTSAWHTFASGLADAGLRFALLACAHPVISCEALAAASLLVLYRAGARAA